MAITWDDVTLSVIGAFIGLAVTLPVSYFIVDRIIERNERKEMEPAARIAKERLTSKLGVGFLTTFLITLVIDVSAAHEENRPIERELLNSYIGKLKTAQSDLEMQLGLYNRVLSAELEHLTGDIISSLEHLQEDFQFLADRYPRPPRETHVRNIERVILQTVHLTKRELVLLGADHDRYRPWRTGSSSSRREPPGPLLANG